MRLQRKRFLCPTLKVGLPRTRPECFDAQTLVHRVEKAGFIVSKLEIFGSYAPGESPHFVIAFNPVMPDKRLPVEKIIRQMGLKVDGGGTSLGVVRRKGRKKYEPVESDVSFEFKKASGKTGADTAIDVIRHLESEIERLRQAAFQGRRGGRRRLNRSRR